MSGILAALAGIKTAIATAVDEYFNRTTLLLNTSSTNGAQNNTFLDSSTNNFTITRNGNTTQGTFTPFSQTGWSNYFGGASNYLSIADNAAFDFGTGNFCVEFWFNAPNQTTSYPAIISSSGYTGALSIRYDNTGYDNKIFVYMGGGGDPVLASTNAIANNVWAHVAVVRDSTTSLKIYVNGVLDGTATISSSLATDLSNGPMYVGRGFDVDGTNAYFTGYVSNIRVTKGGAVYTSAFTPSTAPLTTTVPSGTVSLLSCQSNRFIDNSTNAFSITVSGTPSVQAFSPFAPTAAYDTAVVGGSGYFDGTGDYLNLASNAAFSLGTGDFTIETFVYYTSFTQVDAIAIINWDGGTWSANNWSLHLDHASQRGRVTFWVNNINVGSPILSSGTALVANTWYHIAVTRSGSTWRLFINGVIFASTTSSTSIDGGTNPPLYIGGTGTTSTQAFNGYLSGMRLIKGTALYTQAFTPPLTPLTAVSGTSLLLSATNGAIFDTTAKNVLETVGNAQVSTTQAKWGTTSMYFDGTGDYLPIPAGYNLGFGTGDFTIEGWLYLNATSSYSTIMSNRPNGSDTTTGRWSVAVRSSAFEFYANGSQIVSAGTVSTSTWTHFAVTRASGSIRLFLGGTQVGSTTSFTTDLSSLATWVGANGAGTEQINAYIDDLRVTKGYARYVSNFSVPTAAFPLQ